VSSLPTSASSAMGTPHRGLPPPSAMTLPDPGRGQPSMPPPLTSLSPAPSHWQAAEESSKNWGSMAKVEEEKRKQEEEKTRQETLKLEQRKIEQSMLRESMQGGVPPHLVPLIFAGLGGGNISSMTAEWVQQYSTQLQAAQQQQQAQGHQVLPQSQSSPGLRRETRMLSQGQAGGYGSAPQTPQTAFQPASVLPGQPSQAHSQHAAFSGMPYSGGNVSPRARAAQPLSGHGALTSAPRAPPASQLSRLTTNEIIIQQSPTAQSAVHQLQQSQPPQQEEPSPSIYFHHWVPPTSQQEKSSGGNPPATPSGKYKASSSFPPRQRAVSHASDPDYTSSPKKRKAQGSHPAPPPPTSAPQSHTSPSYSHVSTSSTSTPRRGHARTRSDASARPYDVARGPLSRRGTTYEHEHRDFGAQQTHVPEQRYSQPSHASEGQYQQQYGQQHVAPETALQRGTGHGNLQQARAPSPMVIQTETPQSGAQQQLAGRVSGSVPMSPHREVGRQ
jgi:hypothetical protein